MGSGGFALPSGHVKESLSFVEDASMQALRIETTVQQDGTLTVQNLPLQAGETVEVIILVRPSTTQGQNAYALRGTPITYIDPTEPVAEADWDATQ
jgi:hypothetical protein